ncbi:hypothetical protein PVAND_013472 [Polypedilum vanderplanki]|uniref:Odorant receptor n=1 Tax=Polypedilum vanderplanki TaxID=319348 RepID=A0A9J6CPJ7_POLVA|nr:hypothetical protein PVAND_013472 [Polypedilum vanderplanki]
MLFKLFLNIDVALMELEIPYINWKTSLIGYLIHLIYWFFVTYCFMIALIITNFAIIFYLVSAIVQYDILKELLSELNVMIEQKNDDERNQKIEKLFKLIVTVHSDLLDFLNIFVDLFQFYYFIDIGALFIQIIISLFAISSFGFLPGYMLIIAATFQIFMPCLLSTFIIIKAEEFTENINNILWYLLPVKDQKMLMMILKISQEKKTLSTGFTELNISTFVEMYKAIYSYWMILQELN